MKTLNERDFVEYFTNHALRKAKLYDGMNSEKTLHELLVFTIEELGEVASAITRERFHLAAYECVDLAHCAMLIAFRLHREHKSTL